MPKKAYRRKANTKRNEMEGYIILCQYGTPKTPFGFSVKLVCPLVFSLALS
jgi:hypothetical protein